MTSLLINSRDAAKALSISEKTLWSLTAPRGPVPAIRIGERSVRYSVVALEQWIAEQIRAETKADEPTLAQLTLTRGHQSETKSPVRPAHTNFKEQIHAT